jgi:hypothetical protein
MPSKVENFVNRINACDQAKTWVKDNGITTFQQGLSLCPDPGWLLAAAAQAGYKEPAARRARKWIYQCLLLVQNYLQDQPSASVLKVLENYANGGSTPAELANALATANTAAKARFQADGVARRASAEFHATRALASALSWADNDWNKSAHAASVFAATAPAQKPTRIDRSVVIAQRQKQADIFRSVFAPEAAGLIANLEQAN